MNRRHKLLLSFVAVLAVGAAVVLALIPPEARLGGAIRVVLLHGALARTGLTLFALGGAIGLLALVRPSEALNRWVATAQRVGLVAWIVYFLSSIVATWLTWGVPIAWNEPRTQVSIKILVMVAAYFPLARWVGQPWFAALLNVAIGVSSIVLVKTAGLVQHPQDPVMGANASIFPLLFMILWAILVAIAVLLTVIVHDRSVGRDPR